MTNRGLAIHVEQIDFRKLVTVDNSKFHRQIKLTLDWGQWADSTWKAIEIRLYRVLTQFPRHFHPSLRWTRLESDKLARCSQEIGANRLSSMSTRDRATGRAPLDTIPCSLEFNDI